MPKEKKMMEKLLNGEVRLDLATGGEPSVEEQWLIVPWRALSEGILEDRPLKFSAEVLKKAVPLFNSVPVFPNHWDSVLEWVGKTEGAKWSNATAERPAGVDFELWLDRMVTTEENPGAYRIVKGVELKVLRCGSVDVRFEYEPSHPNLENWRYRLGEEVDGEIVCLEVTRILRIAEFSIVYAGSDKYATRLALDQRVNKEDKMGDQGSEAVRTLLGLGLEAPENEVKSAIKKLKAEAGIKLMIGTGDDQREITNKEVILKMAMDGHVYREKLEERAMAAYKLVRGDRVNQGYLESISGMETTAVLAIAEEYEAQHESLFPLKCSACGSSVTRLVSEGNAATPGDGGGGYDLDNI